VTLIPIAAFLAGSLLTILLPIGLLIALMAWYVTFVRRVPGPDATSATEAPATAPGGGRAAPAADGAEGSRPSDP
jgi:hypothetical protein